MMLSFASAGFYRNAMQHLRDNFYVYFKWFNSTSGEDVATWQKGSQKLVKLWSDKVLEWDNKCLIINQFNCKINAIKSYN